MSYTNKYVQNKDFSSWVVNRPYGQSTTGQSVVRGVVNRPYTKETTTKESIIVSPKGEPKKPMYKEENTTYDEDGNIIEDVGVKLKKELSHQFTLFLKEYEEGYVKNIGDKVPRYTIHAIRRLYGRAIKIGYAPKELLEYLPIFFEADFYEKTDWSPLTFLGEKVLNSLRNQK